MARYVVFIGTINKSVNLNDTINPRRGLPHYKSTQDRGIYIELLSSPAKK